jgi:carbonic anhydrase/acetyltransferase-like protein (isoleucine patch superfamily)
MHREFFEASMIIKHRGVSPKIDPEAWVAPDATVCGDVSIGKGCRIGYGARLISEGAPIRLGDCCIVMENAVLRAPEGHPLTLGDHCLVGPQAHLAGCTLADRVFVATGASIFHGATLGTGTEVRINAVVHLLTELPPSSTVPIGWIAIGNPAKIFPPEKHDEIWALQQPLDFPAAVYGVDRSDSDVMGQITRKRSKQLALHSDDVEDTSS